MAEGDITNFDQWNHDCQIKIHDHENDTFKAAFITSTVTPTAATPDPRWGPGGGTDLSTNQVTPGGNYPDGGYALVNNTVTLVGGEGVFDADDIATILEDVGNPTDARWMILYNDTSLGKECVHFLDLGAVLDLTAADTTISWNAAGIHKLNQAP